MSKNTSFRNARRRNFTMVDNEFLNDPSLTLQAKGLLSIFLSNRDDWKIIMGNIIQRSKNGRDAHYSALKELIEYEYVARIEYINKNGKFDKQEYIFSDHKEDLKEELNEIKTIAQENEMTLKITYGPHKEKEIKSKKPVNKGNSPLTENPDTVNPDTEKPDTESQYINNTNLENTKINNTNLENINLSIKESDIEKLDLPIVIKKQMIQKIDRLIDDQIDISHIEMVYKAVQENINEFQFADILLTVLKETKDKIRNINNLLHTAIKNRFENLDNHSEPSIDKNGLNENKGNRKNPRAVELPKYMQDSEKQSNETFLELDPEFEKKKKQLEETLKKYERSFI